MNKQINRYKEFADKIEAEYNQKAENIFLLQGDVFTVSKELFDKKQNIVFSFKVSRPAYDSYHYTNYIYLPVNDEKIKTLHIKKTLISKILPIKSSYNLIDKSNAYGLSIIDLIEKHKIEVLEEIFYPKDSEFDNEIDIKCASKFLDIPELISLYNFVIDLSDILS
ncbi:hypothetical protein WAF17_18635 [Bernardetia sp. ABR2-2B]|uniref:hypothetical protein n=1 Tax=Bernardetia sp. ABR2-2B TaxID=3127472 RepID=UPI0030CD24AE